MDNWVFIQKESGILETLNKCLDSLNKLSKLDWSIDRCDCVYYVNSVKRRLTLNKDKILDLVNHSKNTVNKEATQKLWNGVVKLREILKDINVLYSSDDALNHLLKTLAEYSKDTSEFKQTWSDHRGLREELYDIASDYAIDHDYDLIYKGTDDFNLWLRKVEEKYKDIVFETWTDELKKGIAEFRK